MADIVQAPPRVDLAWNDDDPFAITVRIAGENLVTSPVTTVINDTDAVFTVAPDGDTAVLTAPELAAGTTKGYRIEWDGRELLAGTLRVRKAGTPGVSTLTGLDVTVNRGDTVLDVTVSPGANGVTSVNGETGAVELTAADVGAATSADLAAHTALTTAAHGGIVADTDARLTDARTPTAHTHVPADILNPSGTIAGVVGWVGSVTPGMPGAKVTVSATPASSAIPFFGTGGVLAVGTPTTATHAATKAYVDGTTITTQAAGFTLSASAITRLNRMTNTAPATVTVPPVGTLSVANWPIGQATEFMQAAAGQVTFAPGAGVTIRTAATLATRVENSVVTLLRLGNDEWLLVGDLEPV